MKLMVFSTKREIREFLKNKEDSFLPKLTTIGEFLEKSVVVKNRSKIDDDLKKIFLYRAVENINTDKLGIKKEFLQFFKNAEFVLSFFNEIYLEKSSIQQIEISDTYLEYEEHLKILKTVFEEYKKLLNKHSLYDRITIDEYEINKSYFENVGEVEIFLSGYLPKFDMEILKKIPADVIVNFRVTKYNKHLIEKMFGDFKYGEYRYDLKNSKVLHYSELPDIGNIKVEFFSNRMDEVNFVFANIEEMIQQGIKPENIAVVLPDENFSEYLKLLDRYNNLNFAMGESFVYSNIYIILEAVFKYITEKDTFSYKKAKNYIEEFERLKTFEEVLNFVLKHSDMKERKLLDEEIFKISKIKELKNYSKDEILHFLLERFKNLSFDDVRGGKITVMGVLESRGMKFEGVIVVDFNDKYVPNVSDKDFFLNSKIRKRSSLPTRFDKESLQKNYYYNIFLNAKEIRISYVKNEENDVSRFLYELNLNHGKNRENYYKDVLFKTAEPKFYEYNETFEKPAVLTPTKLKTLLKCPRKYYFSYVLNIQNDDKKEFFGTKLHNVLQNVLLRGKPSSKEEYFEKIMKGLYKNASKKEFFDIKSQWEEKIKKFAYRDFEELEENIEIECPLKEKKYKSFILKARADRVIGNRIYDYKTSKNKDFLKDLTQAEFYKYLMPNAKIFFWDINSDNPALIEVNPDPKKLEEKIDSIKTFSSPAEDREECKFCEYQFACLHFEF